MQQVAASGKEWHRLAHDLDEFRSQSRTICSVLLWGSVEYNWLIVGPGNALLHTLRAGTYCAARPRVRRAAASGCWSGATRPRYAPAGVRSPRSQSLLGRFAPQLGAQK